MNDAAKNSRWIRLVVAGGCELVFSAMFVFVIALLLKSLADRRAGLPVQQDESGSILLMAVEASLNGNLEFYPMKLELQTSDFDYFYGRELFEEQRSRVIRNWTGLGDVARWNFEVDKPGIFEVIVNYTANPKSTGNEFEIRVANQSLDAATSIGPPPTAKHSYFLGRVSIERPGNYPLEIKAIRRANPRLLVLRRVTLEPTKIGDGS